MNNSNQKTSGASRPSLMSAAPAAPTTPDFPGAQAPTRVLADLGGSTSPKRSRTAVATLASGVIALAAGGIYWASASNGNGTLAVSKPSPATHSASAFPAAAPAAAAVAPTAMPEPATAAARIVTDESLASTLTAPLAKAPLAAVAAAAVATAAPIASPTAKPISARAASATSTKASRAAAAGNAKREKTRTATAKPASGKPTGIAAKKASSGNQAVANTTSAKKPVVTKGPDPDTDLLAALLRRNDGQTQASLAPKDRVR